MGEDRIACGEKKSSHDVSCRNRHSSVMSSCSEDAESESTSAGYPPTPDEDRDQELEYGPGIVNKLRTRFLSISLKQNRGSSMRRSCSLENLLDQERPSRSVQKRSTVVGGESEGFKKPIWGNLKRAKSMDTLLMDMAASEPPPVKDLLSGSNPKKEPKLIRRKDGVLNRSIPTLCDEELPKPDTVKTYKRMFEPAESRRGSHSRRPPVLRASAKSGALAASKMNGTLSNSSAKASATVIKNKFSAKQSPPPAKPEIPEISPVKPAEKKAETPVCNGTYKSTPIKNIKQALCNGKEAVKDTNQVNKILPNKEVHASQIKEVVQNGNTTPNQVSKLAKANESFPCANHVAGEANPKPKLPPNRPTALKAPRSVPKITERKPNSEKKLAIPTKTKPSIESNKTSESESVLERHNLRRVKLKDELKVVEEENLKNTAKNTEDVSLKMQNPPPEVAHNGHAESDPPPKSNSDAPGPDPNELGTKTDVKSGSKKAVDAKTSVVFDFRGKDVVPHVALLPVPFGCKAVHPKKRPLLIDGKEGLGPCLNGAHTEEDEDEDFVDYSYPPPSGLVFEGENVKVGRGSLLSTRNKELKISFDEDMDNNTFIYPSESSMIEDEVDKTDTSAPAEIIPNGQPPPSKLKSNTTIGSSSAGGLSTYTPSVLRTMDNFEPGMFRQPPAPVMPEKEEDKNRKNAGEEENTEVSENSEERDMLKPADPDLISSWSLSAGTSDLLF